jgi:glycosyltransferase involved in cell wall biosynthesis
MIGGGETHVLDLVKTLDPEVFESEVLSFTDGEMVSQLKKINVPCHVLHTEKGFDYKIWPQVQSLMEAGAFDIIHAHGTRACSNSFRAAQKSGLPLVYTIHGWSFHQDQGFLVRTIRTLSERFLVNQSKLNIAVSDSNQAAGIQQLNMPHSVVIKNGINLDKFNPDKAFDLTKAALQAPADKLCIALIARLTVQKDPHTFIRAAAEVLQQHQGVHFVLVGGGDLEASSKALAQELKINEHLSFVGFHTDVPAVLNAIDIYCLPSLWEGLPIGILEAMAMKKPVVATPVDGTKEIITHEKTGLLFPEKNHHALADALIRLIQDVRLREQLGNQARAEIEKTFSTDRVAREVAREYLKIKASR